MKIVVEFQSKTGETRIRIERNLYQLIMIAISVFSFADPWIGKINSILIKRLP